MTSKTSYNNYISYHKFIWENIRQRGWLFAVSTLFLFLLQTVYTTINIDNYLALSGAEFIESYQTSFPELLNGGNNWFLGIGIIALAITSGVTGFAYLHKPKSVDFFHGFPMKREQWLHISYFSGLILFLVPYVIASICTMIMAASKGILISENLLPSIFAIISGILCYFIVYHTTIFAMMLTGKIVVGTLATLVLIVYGSMIQELFFGLISTFLNSYYRIQQPEVFSFGTVFHSEDIASFLSPMGLCTNLLYGNPILQEGDAYVFHSSKSLITFATSVVFLILTWILIRVLYKIRSLEVAGNALAYPKMASFLKIMIVIPTALFIGLYSDSFYYRSEHTWMIFFSILAAILLCGIVEFIYTQDLSQIFKRKMASLISIGSVVVILAFFQFDVFGFDTWLPEKEDVKSMALYSDSYTDYFSYPLSKEFPTQSSHEIAITHTLYSEEAQVVDFSPIYALAEEGIENQKNGITLDQLYQDAYVDYTSIIIRFNTGSKTSKYRVYAVKREHALACLEELCKQESYRKQLFPVFHIASDEIKHMEYSNFINTEELMLTKDQMQVLINAYQEDVLTTPISALQYEEPVGKFTFYSTDTPLFTENAASEMSFLSNILFYPSFQRTLATLEKYGYSMDQKISPANIAQMIHISYVETPEDMIQTATTQTDYKSELRVPITDPKEMQQLLDRICYYPYGIVGSKVQTADSLEVWFKNDTSVTYFTLRPES